MCTFWPVDCNWHYTTSAKNTFQVHTWFKKVAEVMTNSAIWNVPELAWGGEKPNSTFFGGKKGAIATSDKLRISSITNIWCNAHWVLNLNYIPTKLMWNDWQIHKTTNPVLTKCKNLPIVLTSTSQIVRCSKYFWNKRQISFQTDVSWQMVRLTAADNEIAGNDPNFFYTKYNLFLHQI